MRLGEVVCKYSGTGKAKPIAIRLVALNGCWDLALLHFGHRGRGGHYSRDSLGRDDRFDSIGDALHQRTPPDLRGW